MSLPTLTPAETLFNEAFARHNRISSYVHSLRRVGSAGAEIGEDRLKEEINQAVDQMLADYSLVRDKDAFIKSGGPERMKRGMLEMTLQQAKIGTDAATLIFTHSAVDASAFDYCKVIALHAPKDWLEEILGKKVELREALNKSQHELVEGKLQGLLETLSRESLLTKIDLLFAKCRPEAKWSPMEGYKYDRGRIELLDGIRHEVIHGQGPDAAKNVSAEDQNYLLSTSLFLMMLVNMRYKDIQLLPDYMIRKAGS